MSFSFPTSPTTGQQYAPTGGPTYTWNGTAWQVLTPGQQFAEQQFTATAGQTTFTVTGGYVIGGIDVYRNGVKLLLGSDFTATDLSTVVLTNACSAGDMVECVSISQILYTDALKKTGDTMSGNLLFSNSSSISAASTKTLTLNGGGGSNGLVLDASNNVGIGTSSPFSSASGRGNVSVNGSTDSIVAVGAGGTRAGYIYGSSTQCNVGAQNFLVFETNNGNERMRLDSSGNLGLGVTPSAASLPTIQSSYGLFTGNSEAHIARNAYFNTNWVYASSSTATRFSQAGGQFQWFNAPSGTAGNAISFTQAMTLDASGNLLVGKPVTDNSERLGVKSSGSTSSTYGVRVDNSAGTAIFMIRDDGYVRSPTTYNLTSGTANVSIDANGYFTRATSSLRYKKDVVDYDKGLEIVNQLRPVYYKSSVVGADGTIPDTQFAGMIAEEIDALGLSEFVEYGPDGEVESIRYGNMVSLAFKAIQELTAELNELKAKVNA